MVKNCFIALFSIIFTLAAVEAVLVILEKNGKISAAILDQSGREYGLYQDDETLGWRFTPNFLANAQYGDAIKIERINSHGWRNKEVSMLKKRDDYRVVVVGCSRTFGFGVNIEETYGYQLEKLLSMKEGISAEVINFGVNGYGIDQMLLNYRKNVRLYNPDLVIVQVYTPNVMRALFDKMFLTPKPKFIVENDELKILNYPVVPNRLRPVKTWFLDHSTLYRLIYRKFQTIIEQRRAVLEENLESDNEVHELIRQIFISFESMVENDGGELIVFLWDEEERWIYDILKEAGVQVINIFEYADKEAWSQKGALDNPPPVGHWSAIGHEYIAEGIYNYLRKRAYLFSKFGNSPQNN